MQQLTPDGQQLVDSISQRYNLSHDAVMHMLFAVNNGGGTMAQFNCPELGGAGQWMSGGMTMVGDMFNYGLKNTVVNLCNELSNALANMQILAPLPKGSRSANQWWPSNLGQPFSTGAQNNTRYAVFPGRLVVQIDGNETIYDTLDHNIGGVSQQQGGDTSMTFSSQYGTIPVSSLPVVSSGNNAPAPVLKTNFAAPAQFSNEPVVNNGPAMNTAQTPTFSGQSNAQKAMPDVSVNAQTSSGAGADEIIQLIEKVAKLHDAGVLSDEEFNTKKLELLSRI